jgi:beta-N-acetylhexosaminidase
MDAAIAGIRQAVGTGEINETRINASVERVLRAKAALGLQLGRTVNINEADRLVANPQFNAIAQQIADQSITLVRDEQKLLPLSLGQRTQPAGDREVERKGRLLNITFTDEEDRAITRFFVDELRARSARIARPVSIESYTLDQRASETELGVILAKLDAEKPEAVIYSVAVRARSGKGSVALPPAGKRMADELIKRKLPLIVVSFGNPYLLAAMPEAPAYLLAYSPFPVSQRAAAKAVVGEIGIQGKLPVSLPGLYGRGHGLRVERKENPR